MSKTKMSVKTKDMCQKRKMSGEEADISKEEWHYKEQVERWRQ
jgi:hypothetical protein